MKQTGHLLSTLYTAERIKHLIFANSFDQFYTRMRCVAEEAATA